MTTSLDALLLSLGAGVLAATLGADPAADTAPTGPAGQSPTSGGSGPVHDPTPGGYLRGDDGVGAIERSLRGAAGTTTGGGNGPAAPATVAPGDEPPTTARRDPGLAPGWQRPAGVEPAEGRDGPRLIPLVDATERTTTVGLALVGARPGAEVVLVVGFRDEHGTRVQPGFIAGLRVGPDGWLELPWHGRPGPGAVLVVQAWVGEGDHWVGAGPLEQVSR